MVLEKCFKPRFPILGWLPSQAFLVPTLSSTRVPQNYFMTLVFKNNFRCREKRVLSPRLTLLHLPSPHVNWAPPPLTPARHRDLKPENLLLASPCDDTSIGLADFGFAASVRKGFLQKACGTPAYIAPEMLMNIKYGTVSGRLRLLSRPPCFASIGPETWPSGMHVEVYREAFQDDAASPFACVRSCAAVESLIKSD